MDLKLKNNAILTDTSFTKLNYLIATGDCNVNLGNLIRCSSTVYDRIEATLEVVSNGDSASDIFYATGNSRNYYLQCDANSNTSFKAIWGSSVASYQSSISFNGKVNILFGQTATTPKIVVNNVTTNLTAKTNASATNTLYILKGSATVKVWNIKVYQGSTLVRNLIPCKSWIAAHNGEVALYDNVTSNFYYSSSTGTFTSPSSGSITTAYVKDCPNISGINILRNCLNLSRVRIDIGNATGSLQELLSYSTLTGFNDNYESQVKPRLVGTWTINSDHSIAERETVAAAFDGLTVLSDNNYLAEYLLENDMLAVQTLDPNKPNYNPAVAICLNNRSAGHVCATPIVEGGGRWFISKTRAAEITALGTVYRGVTTLTDTYGIVSSDTTAEYDFETFEELQHFGIKSISAGSSTSDLGAFGNCTKLKTIILPNTVTSIGGYGFYDCRALENIYIPNSVTSIGGFTFYNCIGLNNLTLPCSISSSVLRHPTATNISHIGHNVGTFIVKGNISGSSYYSTCLQFLNILIYGNWESDTGGACITPANGVFRAKGSIKARRAGSGDGGGAFGRVNHNLIEGSDFTSLNTSSRFFTGGSHYLFFRKSTLVTATPTILTISYVSGIYVGLGISRTDDEATLQLYANDANWGSYISKISTWYDYNGEYKWYYITDNLTDCTNTNPDEWPHITRGESYQTTIEPDEGLTLSSVQVQMLDTDTTSSTYDTMVDITQDVYDSSTGEINIPNVTGNVVITAVAN